jgi:hypothetical protein
MMIITLFPLLFASSSNINTKVMWRKLQENTALYYLVDYFEPWKFVCIRIEELSKKHGAVNISSSSPGSTGAAGIADITS